MWPVAPVTRTRFIDADHDTHALSLRQASYRNEASSLSAWTHRPTHRVRNGHLGEHLHRHELRADEHRHIMSLPSVPLNRPWPDDDCFGTDSGSPAADRNRPRTRLARARRKPLSRSGCALSCRACADVVRVEPAVQQRVWSHRSADQPAAARPRPAFSGRICGVPVRHGPGVRHLRTAGHGAGHGDWCGRGGTIGARCRGLARSVGGRVSPAADPAGRCRSDSRSPAVRLGDGHHPSHGRRVVLRRGTAPARRDRRGIRAQLRRHGRQLHPVRPRRDSGGLLGERRAAR